MPEGTIRPNMREAYPALIVEVCEGNGNDIPYEIVRYVIVDNKILGKIERDYWSGGTRNSPPED